jgi:hypothetical protein
MNKKLNYRFDKYNTRKPYKIIYIFTEGEKTEVNYFESKRKEIEEEIRRKNIKIEIKGRGRNTLSLVNFAINYIKDERINVKLDDCWIVFDKDDFDKNFDEAIKKAQDNGFKVAYSNIKFELWLLLHFSFIHNAIEKKDYDKKMTENLRKIIGDKKYKYDKTVDIYSLIKDKEKDAIRNAKKLLDIHKNEKSFLKKNPSTTVHLLVEGLNELK